MWHARGQLLLSTAKRFAIACASCCLENDFSVSELTVVVIHKSDSTTLLGDSCKCNMQLSQCMRSIYVYKILGVL